ALVAAVDGVPASGPKVIVSVGQTVSLKLLLKYKNGAVAEVTTDRTTRFSASPARGKFTGAGTWTAQAGDAGRTATLTGSWTLPKSRKRFAGAVKVTVRAVRRRR